VADIDPEEKIPSLADQEASPDAPENLPSDSLEDRLGTIQDRIGEGYKEEGKKGSGLRSIGGKSGAKGLLKNKKAMFGVGGGFLGAIFVAGTIFNFLHTFQMDHFFKFAEQKTSQRLSASLDTRNRSLVRAYMRVRIMEIEGDTKNDSLYFHSKDIKTGSPFRDWYQTMRSSKFEDGLLKKNGIVFTGVVGKDGKISFAKITANDDTKKNLAANLGLKDNMTPDDLVGKLNDMKADDMEKLFTVDKLDSHKAARKSVKAVVNDEIPWYRTFKRRHIRKDLASKTGIKSWRLFEKTRDKVALKQQDIKDRLLAKIVDRYYINNPSSAQFMKCLFGSGRCPSNSDPASPDSKTDKPSGAPEADSKLSGNDTNTDVGPDGKPKTTALDTSGAANDINGITKKEVEAGVKGGAVDEATKAAKLGPIQKITLGIVRTATGDTVNDAIPFNPTKVWTWAKRIAKIDALLYSADKASQLAKLVMNSRTSQLEGIYATYQMANDQIKSGQLSGQELNSFFDTTKNLGNSEGWAVLTNQMDKSGGKVGAASTMTPKQDYCKDSGKRQDFNEFAWFCDDQKPNNGGNAGTISDGYNASVGKILHPVAEGVNTVKEGPIGGIADWITGAVDSIITPVLEPVIDAAMGSGVGKNFGELISKLMMKLLAFLGAGPMFDGTQPGVGNLLIAGGAGSAEDSTRASGGVAQTKVTRAYTDGLAQNYTHEQQKDQSVISRYASLDNPNSLVSSTLFAASSNLSGSSFMTKLASGLQSIPALFGSIISGHVFAQTAQSASYVSDWAGVNKYDIPQQCQSLDPLDPDYLNKSSNVQAVAGISPAEIGMESMRDTDKFWKKVYEKIGTGADAQDKAEKIYNCALFDARVMGSLGAVYGYDKDGGYDPSGKSSTAVSNTPSTSLGISPDGFVFPLQITKSTSANHKPAHWDNTCLEKCHHDYNAADIFADTGTPVVAAKGGQVVLAQHNPTGGSGSIVVIKGEDGNVYSYMHMKSGSVLLNGGEQVRAGDKIGEVGTDADAQGTSSHLHFDVQPPPATTREACADAACAQPPFVFINPQSVLIAAFNNLPD
jgi:hypothetical protein